MMNSRNREKQYQQDQSRKFLTLGMTVVFLLATVTSTNASKTVAGMVNDPYRSFLLYKPNPAQLNNQILSLLTAVCYAYELNLTVAFDSFVHQRGSIIHSGLQKVPYSTYFDEELAKKGLPIIFPTKQELRKIQKLPSMTFEPMQPPIIYPNPDAPYLTSPPPAFYHVPAPTNLDKRVLNLPQIYYWLMLPTKRCHDHIEANFYNYVVPKSSIREQAHAWIEANLQEPFAAIHYRRLDGKCKQNVSQLVDVVEKDLPKHDVKSVFLAADMQDRRGENVLKMKLNPKYFTVHNYAEGYKQGILEQYIISRAKVLYLNSESTFGWNAGVYNKHLHKINGTIVFYTLNNGTFSC